LSVRDDPDDIDRRFAAQMAAAQRGDGSVYAALLQEALPIIRRAARRSGASAADVDDVVQDVLLTVHRVRHTFDPQRSFIAWLTAITRRRTIDLLRRHGRRRSREVSDPIAYESHASDDDPAKTAERTSEARRLDAAIAALPEGQREAILTLGLSEYSLEEAANATGRSKGALKVSLHRAMRALRATLAGDQERER
jgi:RNA polymerase sigma-70 factor (ECF subfamily)